MLECGARFTNELYVKTMYDVESGDAVVEVETVEDGEPVIKTGTVTWDE